MTLASGDLSTVLVVTLTQGAIDNGYISIGRGQFAFFPADVIANEQGEARAAITLLLPTGEQVTTCILSKFGRLQKRLGTMFKQLSLRSGDQLQLTRIGFDSYRFQLTYIPKGTVMTPPIPSASQQDAPMPQSTPSPLNQILFGPPGTGKTYHTIDRALAILDPACLATNKADRPALKARFDELVKEGRIDFVTFHQSFSYEDFVEGIRAESDEGSGQLRYEVVDGVFKRLCNATWSNKSQPGDEEIESADRVIYFRFGQMAKFEADIASAINDKRIQFNKLDVRLGDLVLLAEGTQSLRAVGRVVDISEHQSEPLVASLRWLKVFEPSVHIEQVVPNPSPVHQSYLLKPDRVNTEALQCIISVPEAIDSSLEAPKPRVLIIDEINRGNVSRIFGELITLIEPSKRAGAAEALNTTLPYSKQPFSVPDNLYLIGTMNTADRSLAGLDIALRRRFVFEEMPPRPDLLDQVEVEGVNIGALLRVMNQRIELLLDRDHCLGHAYFMPLKAEPTLKRLGTIFQNQILPLLQEYFFEDWQRIAWVLNDHRKGTVDQFLQAPQVDVSALFGDQVPVGNHRQRWALNESAFARIGAYSGIIKVVAKGGPAESATTAAPEPAFEEEQVAP